MSRHSTATATAASAIANTEPSPAAQRFSPGPWSLRDLLPDTGEAAIENALEKLDAEVTAFEACRAELDPQMSPEAFLAIVARFEALHRRIDVLGGYASLAFSADTQSNSALSFRNRMQNLLTQIHNRALFLELWWKGLDEDQAARLLPAGDENADFRHYLLEQRRFKPYTLDESGEQIVNLKNANGISGLLTVYAMLTNRMEFEVEVDGEAQKLTDGEARSLFYSPDADVRAAVFQEMFKVYEDDAKVLAQIYSNRVRDWHDEFVDLRGVASPISVRNLHNDIPDAAVDTLMQVVSDNAPLFHEYLRMKGRWLGIEPLRRYDLYAPLATSDRKMSFEDAAASVLDTFSAFDPRFGALARRVFEDDHIDSEIRKGKRGGAFCATLLPELTPWVLINYAGRVRDVATLAHELGHAVHSLLAADHSPLTQHPSLPLAETASVFGEMLMTDRLLAEVDDPLARRELLAAAMDDIYATVLRQTYFVRFELEAHRAVLDNRSADDLCDLYIANLRQQFGDSLEVSDDFRYEWLSIPHIYSTPFYCYAYSFGQLLVLALYRRYQEQGDAFIPGYLELLAHGGAARPTEMLAAIDIDITDARFWQGGFDLVKGMLEELRILDG